MMRFQSTLPVGGATMAFSHWPGLRTFQSTLPVGGATFLCQPFVGCAIISIHAPRGGSDYGASRDRTLTEDISIHAPRGGSDQVGCGDSYAVGISIHAPRGGSDISINSGCFISIYFNPRSPWGERPRGRRATRATREFQSTLPVGGATASKEGWQKLSQISIHAPRGGSDPA